MNKVCPAYGKLARFITQAGPDRIVIRHQSARYQDCVQEGPGATSGGGHVEHAATGRALKDEALDEHEASRVKPLWRCREYLEALYKRRVRDTREYARVNADDARAFCDVNLITRGPWLGAVFRPGFWVWDGITHSKDPVQHGAMLKSWRWEG